MKKFLLFGMALSAIINPNPIKAVLNAKQSDPSALGFMQGFPPPRDKLLSTKNNEFFNFPALRYSVNHMNEFYPTSITATDSTNKYRVKTKIDKNIENIMFTPWGEQEQISFKDALDINYTDGIIILHKGKIVYENYPSSGTQRDTRHAAMSLSKSFTGTLAAILADEGVIDPNKPVTYYLPELKNSGYEGASVRNVMDMTTAIKYSEDYNNPDAEIWGFTLSGQTVKPDGYKGPRNYYEYLSSTVKEKDKEHGSEFGYKTINTEVLGWIITRCTGKKLNELLSEKIWKKMGAMYDGYYMISADGIPFAGGGYNLSLIDAAYFGETMRCKGMLGGKRIISERVIEDIMENGGSKENIEHFAKSGEYPLLKGWGYRDMWWCTNNSHGAFMARGVHGQAIYVDPKAEMVIARFASSPLASNKYIDPHSIPLYEAVAEYLMNK